MAGRLTTRLANYMRSWLAFSRPLSESQSAGERLIASKLKERFPNASAVAVQDISGGCGAMYEVYVEAPDFVGKRTVQQHMLVSQALKEEIKGMHGIRINTSAPRPSLDSADANQQKLQENQK